MTDGPHFFDQDGQPMEHLAWAAAFENFEARQVARTELADDVAVSTVWLGIDHRFGGDGPPLIFETMIFGGPHDQECWRYPSRVAALAGHDQAVALAADSVRHG